MNRDKSFKYAQRWRELTRQQSDLDHARSTWCKEVRAEFPGGESGDDKFATWCEVELDLTASEIDELLLRAAAAKIVPDEVTWKSVGGFKAIAPLTDLNKLEQVNVLQAALAGDKAIRTVMRERGHVAPAPKTAKSTLDSDARVLARYLKDAELTLPKHIVAIINRILK